MDAFFLEREEVTTARFAAFVTERGYETDAERYGWSLVFHEPGTEPEGARVVAAAPWWVMWRAPTGGGRAAPNTPPPRTTTRPPR